MNEKDSNIFETASKKLSKKAPKPTPKENKPIDRYSDAYQDPEISGMLEQIKIMKGDLQSKFELIRKTFGWSEEQMQLFLQNPNVLTPHEKNQLQTAQTLLDEKVSSVMGQEISLNPTKSPEPKIPKGDRKSKTLGGRKKWIPL